MKIPKESTDVLDAVTPAEWSYIIAQHDSELVDIRFYHVVDSQRIGRLVVPPDVFFMPDIPRLICMLEAFVKEHLRATDFETYAGQRPADVPGQLFWGVKREAWNTCCDVLGDKSNCRLKVEFRFKKKEMIRFRELADGDVCLYEGYVCIRVDKLIMLRRSQSDPDSRWYTNATTGDEEVQACRATMTVEEI